MQQHLQQQSYQFGMLSQVINTFSQYMVNQENRLHAPTPTPTLRSPKKKVLLLKKNEHGESDVSSFKLDNLNTLHDELLTKYINQEAILETTACNNIISKNFTRLTLVLETPDNKDVKSMIAVQTIVYSFLATVIPLNSTPIPHDFTPIPLQFHFNSTRFHSIPPNLCLFQTELG
ncbi:hypothetical protein BD770DRAFT_414830 [Pilaira anomala]|nr:hypothetical protein BD770DRAFT_414830 [Pilaira anomala]